MMNLKANAATLIAELQWLGKVMDTRMKLYWNSPGDDKSIYTVIPPDLSADPSPYAQLVRQNQLNFEERIILLLALAPHVQPQLLDIFFIKNAVYDRGFTEFGGIKGANHAGFIPTGETAAFILAANDIESRFRVVELLNEEHLFHRAGILKLVNNVPNEPFLSGVLQLDTAYLSYCTLGVLPETGYGIGFPAQKISTPLEWEELVLEEQTLTEVSEILDWIRYGEILLQEWGMSKKIRPGYRALFYGPPGTGKTVTACLLGKAAGLDVYRVDLALLVSQYIGDTEKNIANIFDQAQHKNWLLFFDDAEALSGGRTQSGSSNDLPTNQAISFLLQHIENYPGVVMLAANSKTNLDEAFTRRFQSMIYFAMPTAAQRKKLWQNTFSGKAALEETIDLDKISEAYELAGASIINVVRYSSLMAIKSNTTTILLRDVLEGIRRELAKF